MDPILQIYLLIIWTKKLTSLTPTLINLRTTGVDIIIGSAVRYRATVLRHLILCKSKGTLFVPTWPSFYHWPLIYTDWDQMANFVKQNMVIEPFLEKSVNRSLMVIDRGIYAQTGYWESRIFFLTCLFFFFFFLSFNNIAINISQCFTNDKNTTILYSCHHACRTSQLG